MVFDVPAAPKPSDGVVVALAVEAPTEAPPKLKPVDVPGVVEEPPKPKPELGAVAAAPVDAGVVPKLKPEDGAPVDDAPVDDPKENPEPLAPLDGAVDAFEPNPKVDEVPELPALKEKPVLDGAPAAWVPPNMLCFPIGER